MKITQSLAFALLLALALAGCNRSTVTIDGKSGMKHLTIQSDRVGVKAADGSSAWIDASGGITIDNEVVELSAAQRTQAMKYFTAATGVRSDGLAVGKAGAAVAGKAVTSVIQGLASGNPDDIGPKIEAEAKTIEAKAMLLCQRVGELRSAQDALAHSLPAFAPYATITIANTEDCNAG